MSKKIWIPDPGSRSWPTSRKYLWVGHKFSSRFRSDLAESAARVSRNLTSETEFRSSRDRSIRVIGNCPVVCLRRRSRRAHSPNMTGGKKDFQIGNLTLLQREFALPPDKVLEDTDKLNE